LCELALRGCPVSNARKVEERGRAGIGETRVHDARVHDARVHDARVHDARVHDARVERAAIGGAAAIRVLRVAPRRTPRIGGPGSRDPTAAQRHEAHERAEHDPHARPPVTGSSA
jgi:hypothetical protein